MTQHAGWGPLSSADSFPALLGMTLLQWAPGQATVSMRVTEELTNALGRTHGGAVFALADAAISRAANHPGQPAVLTSSTVQILRPSGPGDLLVARAEEEYRGRRVGAYQARVFSGEKLIATSTAQSMPVVDR